MIGFCQRGNAITFPVVDATVGTPPFAAALVAVVALAGKLLEGTLACGTGMLVAPPIIDMFGRLLAYAPFEITGCGAGGATTALLGATGTSCPFTTAENVDMCKSIPNQSEEFQSNVHE